eukprot:gene7648-9112_t
MACAWLALQRIFLALKASRNATGAVKKPATAAVSSGEAAGGSAGKIAGTAGPVLGKRPREVSAAEKAGRMALLNANSELKHLYKSTVEPNVVSEADFWQMHRQRLEAATAKEAVGQRVGISNALMAEVTPTSDGRSNVVKFSLTPEQMHQIFAEKPAVRKAYRDKVPHVLSEKEFWFKYCRAQYFEKTTQGPS